MILDWIFLTPFIIIMFISIIIMIINYCILKQTKTCLNCIHIDTIHQFEQLINENKEVITNIDKRIHYCDILQDSKTSNNKPLKDLKPCDFHEYKLIIF